MVCVPSVRIVGPGRAGSSLADALAAAGWDVTPPVRRADAPAGAAAGVDVCVIAVPDRRIAEVAGAIDPVPSTVVAHLAGSLGADVLAPHPRRAAIHPLAALLDARRGAAALSAGVWWAVEGDPGVLALVADLHGRIVEVPPEARAAYHAAACIAANHLVALLAQVERVAAGAGLPAGPFYDLAAGALANARAAGAAGALTGPASRGDQATIAAHLAAIGPLEADLYTALSAAAAALAGLPAPVAAASSAELAGCR
jgi:predicted short-subunit dehydrogenase-like oxidoreductase (DUF2520 family)